MSIANHVPSNEKLAEKLRMDLINDPMFKKLNEIIEAHEDSTANEISESTTTVEISESATTTTIEPTTTQISESDEMLNSIKKSLQGLTAQVDPKVSDILKSTIEKLDQHSINTLSEFDENLIELTESEAPLSSNFENAHHISKRLQIAKDMNLIEQVVKVDERNVKYLKYLESTRENKTLSKHLPNMIIVGAKKCGTGALSSFLDIHPKAHYAGEVYYFNREIDTKSLKWYESKMPMSPAGDIVFEKTPDYFFQADIPEKVKEFNPNVKIITVLCDPVKRVLSDFLHMNRHNLTGRDAELFRENVFEGFQKINKYKKLMQESRRSWFDMFLTMNKKFAITGVLKTFAPVILRSAYVIYLRNWYKHFPVENVMVIDGSELKKDPTLVMGKVQDFLGLEKIIDESNFYFDDERQLFCSISPSKPPKCTGEGKGRSNKYQIDDETRFILKQFFQPFNHELADILKIENKFDHWNF